LTDSTQDSNPAKKRRFPRYPIDVRIQLSVFRQGTTKAVWGRTNEIGQDGIGATLTEGLEVGEVVSMEFPIPVAPYQMKVRAVVRYASGLRCGFEFLVISDDLRDTLRKTCDLLNTAF
jgi:PilZ domain-containing protein